MINKTILVLAIAAAFVAGTMTSINFVDAQKSNGQPFQELWDAIAGLQMQIEDIELTPGPPGNDGAPGDDGINGTPWQDGSSCSIDGTIVSCTDGTESDVQGTPGKDANLEDLFTSKKYCVNVMSSADNLGSQTDLSNCDFSMVNFHNNRIFEFANLSGSNFKGSDLGLQVFRSDFSDADFTGASIVGSFITESNFDNAIFKDTQMQQMGQVSGSSFVNADFTGADLTGSTIDGTNDFTGAILDCIGHPICNP